MKLSQGRNLTDDRPEGPPRPPAAAEPREADIADWVALHWDAVYKLLYRLGNSRHDAEDLSQETFLRAIERQSSFTPGTNLKAWLLRIATNAFLDRQRRRKVMKIAPLPDDTSHVDASVPRPGERLEVGETHRQVLDAIATLPETARVVFLLRCEQELSFRDIADVIGTSEETARWHMMQARKALLAKLDGKLD